ncbi:RNA polymerase factor sigma-54 [uncultured Arcticibacterium sp.]|uniref:RNA polymerase factor sigma-54 n=1 Tax=uncultured Arcticibacterium sp. TaxID=2173042 RepID=UPI0030FA5B20
MPSQKLVLSQKQGLKISPRQIQFLHFLQFNEAELEQEIKKELEENPVLDFEEENDSEIYDFQRKPQHTANEKPLNFLENNQAVGFNIIAELKEHFRYLNLSEKTEQIADFILDSVDEKGYLNYSLEELEDVLSFGMNMLVGEGEIAKVIEQIKHLEPNGVGCKNLQEFMLFQAQKLKSSETLLTVLGEHFDLLAERKFDEMCEHLEISNDDLKLALEGIVNLKPYPLHGFELATMQKNESIVPEYKVDFRDGELVYGTLSKSGKKLVFNENYGKEFKVKSDKKLHRFLMEKRESAVWFMQAVEEREHTMNVCIEAVVKLQESYFKSGSTSDLKPMVLKDVAMLTGKTISTLSRVTSQKYVQTHFGLVPMKSLFTEAIQKNDGQLISNKEVQEIVSKLVSDENKQKPLTDAEICRKLVSDGFSLTRRTITKYRENMNIPSSKLRRAL